MAIGMNETMKNRECENINWNKNPETQVSEVERKQMMNGNEKVSSLTSVLEVGPRT